jgi:hypothetical protein
MRTGRKNIIEALSKIEVANSSLKRKLRYLTSYSANSIIVSDIGTK